MISSCSVAVRSYIVRAGYAGHQHHTLIVALPFYFHLLPPLPFSAFSQYPFFCFLSLHLVPRPNHPPFTSQFHPFPSNFALVTLPPTYVAVFTDSHIFLYPNLSSPSTHHLPHSLHFPAQFYPNLSFTSHPPTHTVLFINSHPLPPTCVTPFTSDGAISPSILRRLTQITHSLFTSAHFHPNLTSQFYYPPTLLSSLIPTHSHPH